MKKGLMILVALSIALVMGASMLVAQEKSCGEKEKGTCKSEVKLTDEQKAKVEDMKMSFRLKMIDLKAEREKLHIALKKEMMKPEPAMKDIEPIVKKMSAVREKIILAGIEQKIAMRKILGPDACKGMHGGMGMGRSMEHGMMSGRGMSSCHEGRMGHEHDMPAKRMMKMRTEASGCHGDGAEKEIECKVEIKEEAKKK